MILPNANGDIELWEENWVLNEKENQKITKESIQAFWGEKKKKQL